MRYAALAAVLIGSCGVVAACDKSPQTATAPSAVAAAAEAQRGAPDAPGQKRYRVTIENLTTGQPFLAWCGRDPHTEGVRFSGWLNRIRRYPRDRREWRSLSRGGGACGPAGD